MQNLFVYGTLLFPEITEKLTGKSFETLPAILKGYKMYCVKDCDYPAIINEEGAETKGKILLNIDDFDLKILSVYEGDEYEWRKIKVLCNDKLEDAITFVWSNGVDRLESRGWDFADFQKERLEYYLDVIIPDTLDDFPKE